jgi:lysophospholipase L1-like esterase
MPHDRIVFAGDSVTFLGGLPGGWIETFNEFVQKSHPGENITVIASGVGGDTSKKLLARFDTSVLNFNPSVVVFYIGINDIGTLPTNSDGTANLTGYLTNMSEMINKAKAHPGVRSIVIMTPMLHGDQWDPQGHWDPRIDQMASALRSVCSYYQYPLIDVRQEFTTAEHSYNPDDKPWGILVDSSMVHPTQLGSSLLAGTVLMGFGD